MILFITGLFLWFVVHLFPVLCIKQRSAIINKTGLMPYKGVFALIIISSVVLIVFGWRSIVPEDIYVTASWGRHVAFLLVLFTFILFVAANAKTNIKRFLRHPQLTGLVLWSIGHLFANGDCRSVVLFVTLGVWALLMIILINRRDGAWQKPEAVSFKFDVLTVFGGCVLYTVLLFAHVYLTGIKLMPS